MVAQTFDAPGMGRPGDDVLIDNRITSEWIAAAAAYLKISPNALRIMLHRGQVKAHKIGRQVEIQAPGSEGDPSEKELSDGYSS